MLKGSPEQRTTLGRLLRCMRDGVESPLRDRRTSLQDATLMYEEQVLQAVYVHITLPDAANIQCFLFNSLLQARNVSHHGAESV